MLQGNLCISVTLLNICFFFTDNSDITVVCGTNKINLQILLCPIYFNGYNESTMALNAEFAKPECIGTADWTVDPPVLKFQFLITETAISTCSNKLTVLIILILIKIWLHFTITLVNQL